MSRTDWTNERLAHLFQQYRRRYWPNSRRLRVFTVQTTLLGRSYGRCEIEARVIHINVLAHPSDRELRATMLHEMIHAVVGRPGHHAPFWTQLEYLLACKAPISVSFPELGEQGSHLCVIPARFRRCRRLFAPVYRRWQRDLDREELPEYTLTPGDMETECEDAAVNGAVWRSIWFHQARLYGFVDLDGRLLPWGRKWRHAARRGYLRGRRFYLANERLVEGRT